MKRIKMTVLVLAAAMAVSVTSACNMEEKETASTAAVSAVASDAENSSPEYRMLHGTSEKKIQALIETDDIQNTKKELQEVAGESGFELSLSAEKNALVFTYTAKPNSSSDDETLGNFGYRLKTKSGDNMRTLATKMRDELNIADAAVIIRINNTESENKYEEVFEAYVIATEPDEAQSAAQEHTTAGENKQEKQSAVESETGLAIDPEVG